MRCGIEKQSTFIKIIISKMATETTPLFPKKDRDPPSKNGSIQPSAYFIEGKHHRRESSEFRATFGSTPPSAVKEINRMPPGGVAAEFNPRPVPGRATPNPRFEQRKMKALSVGGGLMSYIADMGRTKTAQPSSTSGIASTGEIGTLLLPRKAPVKVEPKVHFANERTFLTWLHVCVVLAGASVAIVSFSKSENIANQLYGIVLLPVSIAFMFYALYQCKSLMCIMEYIHTLEFLIAYFDKLLEVG